MLVSVYDKATYGGEPESDVQLWGKQYVSSLGSMSLRMKSMSLSQRQSLLSGKPRDCKIRTLTDVRGWPCTVLVKRLKVQPWSMLGNSYGAYIVSSSRGFGVWTNFDHVHTSMEGLLHHSKASSLKHRVGPEHGPSAHDLTCISDARHDHGRSM